MSQINQFSNPYNFRYLLHSRGNKTKMAKLTLFAANLVVLVAVAVAFDFSTLIPDLKTLDIFKGKAPSCEKEMQKQQLDFCQRYLQESSRFQPSFTVVHQASSWREAFRQCCEQLEKFSKKCRCDAIRQIVLQQMQGEQLEGIERQDMLQTAQSLPNLCRIKKAQPCNVPAIFGFILGHFYAK